MLELGPDAETENRLAKALWELGELGEARDHYQIALALDPRTASPSGISSGCAFS